VKGYQTAGREAVAFSRVAEVAVPEEKAAHAVFQRKVFRKNQANGCNWVDLILKRFI